MLSLREQKPAPAPAPRLSRAEAVFISVGVHLLFVLLVLLLPQTIPRTILALLQARRPAELEPSTAEWADGRDVDDQAPPIPLQFAYVRLPDDTPVESNPTAPFLSNANRLARQEEPTPADAEQFSIDPHAEGDSLERVQPDPNRPEGQENPLPESSDDGDALQESTPVEASAGEGDDGDGTGMEGAAADDDGRPAPTDGRTAAAQGGDGGGERGNGVPAGSATAASTVDPQQKLRQAMSDIRSEEFKFSFHNPAYLRQGSYGTLSFDTQDFPWGNYASILHAKLLSNWISRLPLAYREGARGYACIRFYIERDGSISEITAVRPSHVPPFTRAADSAINATDDLPPLPEHYPGEREGITGCFFYNMHPSEARR